MKKAEIEIYKDIIGYEGMYQISNLGNVKSLPRKGSPKEKILIPKLINSGYLKVSLCKNKNVKNRTIHQLVAVAFLGHVPCGRILVVNHINFNKLDNRAVNLEVITFRENTNQKHIKSSSQYVGVYWKKDRIKWRASIYTNGKQKHLGYFNKEEEAHLAYEKELKIIEE